MVKINGVEKPSHILDGLAKAFKDAGIKPLNYNYAGNIVSTKINLNINITTDYDENYFYFYNNGKPIKRITLEQALDLFKKL